VALAFLAGAFYFATQALAQREVYLDGVRILSDGDVQQGIRDALSGNPVVLEERVTAENSTQNSGIAMMGTEIVYALATSGRETFVYAVVDDGTLIGCENATLCANPRVIIRPGECDCLQLTGGTMVIEGSPEFMYNASMVVRGLVNMALAG